MSNLASTYGGTFQPITFDDEEEKHSDAADNQQREYLRRRPRKGQATPCSGKEHKNGAPSHKARASVAVSVSMREKAGVRGNILQQVHLGDFTLQAEAFAMPCVRPQKYAVEYQCDRAHWYIQEEYPAPCAMLREGTTYGWPNRTVLC